MKNDTGEVKSLRWDSISWINGGDEVIQAFIHTMRTLAIKAGNHHDLSTGKDVSKHAFKLCDLHKVRAAIELTRSIPKRRAPSPLDSGKDFLIFFLYIICSGLQSPNV